MAPKHIFHCHVSLFTKRTPHSQYPTQYPLTFGEYSLSFVLGREKHKYHSGGYPESSGPPWRISGKHLHNKSTLSSVLLQDAVIKIKPSSAETGYFRFMPSDCCTGITLYHFPWGVRCVCFTWPSKLQLFQPVSDWTSLASGVDRLSFKSGATEAMLAGRWKTWWESEMGCYPRICDLFQFIIQ